MQVSIFEETSEYDLELMVNNELNNLIHSGHKIVDIKYSISCSEIGIHHAAMIMYE